MVVQTQVKEQRTCKGPCGETYGIDFFNINKTYYSKKKQTFGNEDEPKIYYNSICKGCEEKERIERRKGKITTHQFREKATATVTYHATQEGMTKEQFEKETGVTVDYVEALFKEQNILENLQGSCEEEIGLCHCCGKPFAHMRGFDDYTIDRRDPTRRLTRSNLWVTCSEYNKGKQDKDPTEYDLTCQNYRRHEEVSKSGNQIILEEKGVNFILPTIEGKEPTKRTLCFANYFGG